jgi:glyoxylase I family protein
MAVVSIRNFSHVSVNVTNLEASMRFYLDILGFKVLFDVELAGPGLEAVTESAGAKGRMVGCLVPGGGMIELVAGIRHGGEEGAIHGENDSMIFSLSVDDLDEAYRTLKNAGVQPLQEPAEVEGVRMFFVSDPDGRRIELIEFPGDATRTSEHHGYQV